MALRVRRFAALIAIALILNLFGAGPALAFSRIKDIADIEGIRENHLVGYGLVVGLDGTGDRLQNTPFTRQSLQAMLERLGVNTLGENVLTENVAAVMVTASLPAFTVQGSRIDVVVSALGDAESLRGGQLLVTPLMGADGNVYAVAQGAVTSSGFSAGGQAETVTRGVPTNGRIPNGGIVEREIPFTFADNQTLRLALRNPDFTTARRVSEAINRLLGQPVAKAMDPTRVDINLPPDFNGDVVALLTDIEQLFVEPDQAARVVVDERSGVIVMGQDVRISTVAIAQGNLTIRVSETPQVSQPNPFGGGDTQVVPRTEVQIDDQSDRQLILLEQGVSLQSLVDGLNALGVGPQDMISILQSIKRAGALQAELVVH